MIGQGEMSSLLRYTDEQVTLGLNLDRIILPGRDLFCTETETQFQTLSQWCVPLFLASNQDSLIKKTPFNPLPLVTL